MGRHMHRQQQQDDSHTVAALAFLGCVVVVVVVRVICGLCSRLRGQEPAAGPGGRRGPSADESPRLARQAAAETKKAGPAVVVCAYRGADGWREAPCPVCLSDFTDGEAVSVLPVCLHYFHAACVAEWLRAQATCPLCRAAPAAATA